MNKTNQTPMDTGIEPEFRKQIADGLARLLADTYTLYLKTHNFHWNVTGPRFQELHLMFEGHYNEMALAVDEIAERIRALNFFAPGSYAAFSKLTRIKEAAAHPASAEEMVRALGSDHEALVRTAREIIPAAEKGGDQVSADLLTARMKIHEKTAWMFRSLTQ